jgi:hypothetical protein
MDKYYISDEGYLINTRTYEKQHREVMGPILLDALEELFPNETWVTHHKDGDKTNNDIFNLEVFKQGEHIRMHRKGKHPYAYYKHKNISPWKRVWSCRLRYNNKLNSLGQFEDFISCEIVAELVKEEINDLGR